MANTRDGRKRLTIGEQRQRAASLRAKSLSYAEIGLVLNVSPTRARDLCKQYERWPPLLPPASYQFELSPHAVSCLVGGTRSAEFGSQPHERHARLLEIAASYRRSEFQNENGVGPGTLAEVETWLESKGLCFRPRLSRISDAIAHARLRAMEERLATAFAMMEAHSTPM